MSQPPLIVPPPDDPRGLHRLADFLDRSVEPLALTDAAGRTVDLPDEAIEVLVEAMEALRVGCAASVAAVEPDLTLSDAANLAGLSTDRLSRLVADGRLHPVSAEGVPRLPLVDVMRLREETRAERRAVLDELGRAGRVAYRSGIDDFAVALTATRQFRGQP